MSTPRALCAVLPTIEKTACSAINRIGISWAQFETRSSNPKIIIVSVVLSVPNTVRFVVFSDLTVIMLKVLDHPLDFGAPTMLRKPPLENHLGTGSSLQRTII